VSEHVFFPAQGRCNEIHEAIKAAGGRGFVLRWHDVDRFCAHQAGCCWEPFVEGENNASTRLKWAIQWLVESGQQRRAEVLRNQNAVSNGDACCKGVDGCFCAVGYPSCEQCADCRSGRTRDSYCVCAPKGDEHEQA